MASDRLFEMLAAARAQPDRWSRDVSAGTDAGSNILNGYLQGLAIKRQMQSYPLQIAQQKAQLFDNYSKLSDAVGPDRANQLMGPVLQQAGISMPSGPSSSPSGPGVNPAGNNVNPDMGSSTPNPSSLIGQGSYGTKTLGNIKTAQEISLANQPRDPNAVRASIMQSGAMSPQDFDVWAQANMDQNGKIPSQALDSLQKNLDLKAQGNRADFYHTQIGRNQLELLPSQQGPNTAAGAAYQVKVAARQGKSLIANATSPQNLNLASNDLARAVQRATPTSETIGASNYGNSLSTIWGQLSQKITSDPNSPDVPLLRKQLYDTFNELDQAATPWINNHLANMEANGTNSSFGNSWGATKQREMGLNIPDVPFNASPSSGSAQNPNVNNGLPTQPNPKDPAGLFQ